MKIGTLLFSHDKWQIRLKFFNSFDNGIWCCLSFSHEKDNLLRKFEGIFRNNADYIEELITEGIKSKNRSFLGDGKQELQQLLKLSNFWN